MSRMWRMECRLWSTLASHSSICTLRPMLRDGGFLRYSPCWVVLECLFFCGSWEPPKQMFGEDSVSPFKLGDDWISKRSFLALRQVCSRLHSFKLQVFHDFFGPSLMALRHATLAAAVSRSSFQTWTTWALRHLYTFIVRLGAILLIYATYFNYAAVAS